MFNPRITLKGAFDLHIHTAPDVFPRYLNDLEAAQLAKSHGMAGIMLKCHHESTVSRALHIEAQITDIHVYGGIVLNLHVGGLNVRAVETALKDGAKEIWMPTTDSEFHRKIFGSVGSYGLPSMEADNAQKKIERGITILNARGKLLPEIIDIIDLVTEFDAIFGTSHLSPEEDFEVLDYIQGKSTKLLLTHPFFRLPNLDLETMIRMADKGAIFELVAVDHFNLPTEHHPTVYRAKEAIETIGPDKFILSSDAGQPFNPNPVEAIRVVAESLFELGIPKEDLHTIMIDIPKKLVGLDS